MELYRPNGLTAKDLCDIETGAAEILENIGIQVTNPEWLERLKETGVRFDNDRALVDESVTIRILEERKRLPSTGTGHTTGYTGEPSSYSSHYECPITGEVLLFTSDILSDMTRFMQVVSEEYGISPGVPGYPADIPVELESAARYYYAALHCETDWPKDPTSVRAAGGIFRMAEIMGEPMREMSAYMASPLRFGGESFDIIFAYHKRLKSITVTSMPSLGATTPLSLIPAYALTLAEVVGGAYLLNLLTGLPADFAVRLLPFDFYDLNISFGTPENTLLEWLNAQINAHLHGIDWTPAFIGMYSWASRAGVQATAEKGLSMISGMLAGSRSFPGMGTLSLDEVFSPVQLLLDIELLKTGERLMKGMPVERQEEDLTELIRDGMRTGFITHDHTLENHKEYIRNSRLFTRKTLSAQGNNPPNALENARAQAIALMKKLPGYQLDKVRKKEITAIYQRLLAGEIV